MFDPMSDLTAGPERNDPLAGSAPMGGGQPRSGGHGGGGGGGHRGGDGGGRFAQDLHSITIHARQRTFYVDLKESGNGKFFKISEKSRGGQKTTIMFDVEDLDKFIEALNDMKTRI